jgi:hypothetical protein
MTFPTDPVPPPKPPPPPPPRSPPPPPPPLVAVKHDNTKVVAMWAITLAAIIGGVLAGLLLWSIMHFTWWALAPAWQEVAVIIVLCAGLPALLVYSALKNWF